MTATINKGNDNRARSIGRNFTAKRSAVALVLLAVMVGVSACSAESPNNSVATNPASSTETSGTSVVTESPSASATAAALIHDQASDESNGFYFDGNIKWLPYKLPDGSLRNVDPNGDAGNVAANLNQFLQRVPIEWTNSPSKAFPEDTPTRKVFPESSKYVSESIPEYQAKKLFSAITNTVDLWRDVILMADFRFVEFSEDGKTARVPVEAIGGDASPRNGLQTNGLKDKHADPDSGDILFVKDGDNWKISGIGGYYGKDKCLWECR